MAIDLDMLAYRSKLNSRSGPDGTFVFDPVRKKWVTLTREEFVRQLFILFLMDNEICPAKLISVERQITLGEKIMRYDLALYSNEGVPWMLIECKAPEVPLSQDTVEQAARYNLQLRVPVLAITNGQHTYCCRIDLENGRWEQLDHIPDLAEVLSWK